MTRRAKIWRGVAALFAAGNLVGLGMALADREPLHSAAHVALALLGAYVVWWLTPRARPQELAAVQQTEERLHYLQQSVDAIALEVERLGEAQRFSARLRADQGETPPPKRQT